jgi:hypothetical protein
MRRLTSPLAALAAVMTGACDPPPPVDADAGGAPRAASAPADIVALLDGVRPGDVAADARLSRVDVTPERSIALVFLMGEAELPFWIARKGTQAFRPPRSTERYDLFFGKPTASVPDDAVTRILEELERRVRRTEDRVPVPAGL